MGKDKSTKEKLFKDGKSLNAVFVPFAKSIQNHLVAFIKSLEKQLKNKLNEPECSEKQKNQLNAHLSSIKVHQRNVLSSYLHSLKNTFQLFGKKQFNYFDEETTQVVTKDDLKKGLIDKDDILLIHKQKSLIRKHEKHYIALLFNLKQRLTTLTGSAIDSAKLPFGPFVLVSAFSKSIKLFHFNSETTMRAFDVFEKEMLNCLNPDYEKILDYLNTSEDKAVEKVKVKTVGTNTAAKKAIANTIGKDTLFKALTIVQNNISLNSPLAIKKSLLEQIDKHKTADDQVLAEINRDQISLTTLIFQQLTNDNTIADDIKIALSKLQIPYLKVALSDETFLENSNHTAKQLLELLATTSVGWNPEDDENNDYINTVKQLVNSVLNQDDLSRIYFQILIDEFHGYYNQKNIPFLDEQKKIIEKSQGKNKIQTAMRTVDALIAFKIEEHDTAPIVKSILQGSWKNLLVLLLVRHSNSSSEYLKMINFIDDLFEIFTPNHYEFILNTNIDNLCDTYKQGLKLIAYQDDEIEKKSEELKHYLINYHKSLGVKKIDKLPEAKIPSDKITTKTHAKITPLTKPKPKQKVEINADQVDIYQGLSLTDKELVKAIDYGTWLDFKHQSGRKIRAKLSWVNPKTGKFLFVNERGLKITDRTAQQLADDIRSKDIKIVES